MTAAQCNVSSVTATLTADQHEGRPRQCPETINITKLGKFLQIITNVNKEKIIEF